MAQVGQFYQGSGLLQPLCDVTGLPLDQINFLACNVVAFVCGFLMRRYLPAGKSNCKQRHTIEFSIGLALGFFCFGYQVIHLVVYCTVPYLLMLYGPKSSYHVLTFTFAMVYLAVMHLYRLYYDYGGFSLDVTGPMMLMTQKVTSIAFALHDGKERQEKSLTDDQNKQCIRQIPDILSYCSYVFSFHNIMAGPLVFYADYIKFIDGESLKVTGPQRIENSKRQDPCPNEAMKECVIIAVVNGILMLFAPIYFPVTKMADENFLHSNVLVRHCYLVISLFLHRTKYYFAWKLGELTNLAAGLGFRGYDEKGKEKWDLLQNVKIWQLETSTSLKVFLDSWNIHTLVWLRRIVYDRMPSSINTLAVFMCSAVWHGFYGGYYLTFVSTAMAILAARLVRRHIRPYFQETEEMKFFYDCVTFLGTRFASSYLTFPFAILELTVALKVLLSFGFYVHVLCAGTFIYFKFIKSPKKRLE